MWLFPQSPGRQGVPATLIIFWHPSHSCAILIMYILHGYIIYKLQYFTRRSRGLSAQLAHFHVLKRCVGRARAIPEWGGGVRWQLACVGTSAWRCGRVIVALSRWAPLAWVAVGRQALARPGVHRVVVSASGTAVLALSALLGGVRMAVCGTSEVDGMLQEKRLLVGGTAYCVFFYSRGWGSESRGGCTGRG